MPRWKLCYRRMQDPRNFAMVWVQELLQEQKAVFGPDPWPYNLATGDRGPGDRTRTLLEVRFGP